MSSSQLEPGNITTPNLFMCSFVFRVYKVTSDYFYESTKIWKGKGKWESELYPHRFRFDKNPLILVKNCRINKLGLTSKKELHTAVYSNIRMCDPSSLVDILHYAEKMNLEESLSELEYVAKIIKNKK